MSRWTFTFRMPRRVVWSIVLLAIGCGACGADNQSADDRSADDQSASDAFAVVHEWTTQATHRDDAFTGNVLLEGVTVTEQPGFDRMVFTFRDTLLPGYTIEPVSRPIRQCGSGQPVELGGPAALEVQFLGAQAHTEEGTSTPADRTLTVQQPVIREAVLTCDFEGHVTWGIGLDRSSSYRVLQDTSAGRIAIDVRH